jgi:short-subunit dehydrogenase
MWHVGRYRPPLAGFFAVRCCFIDFYAYHGDFGAGIGEDEMSKNKKRELALITGASGGIGEALAHCFAEGGFDLVLVARSGDKLQALAESLTARYGVTALVEACDLSVSGNVDKLAARLSRRKLEIDVLVNNAGVLEQGAFVAIDQARQLGMIDLNITALSAMLARFVPPMVKRGHGRILNVASIAAFQPIPGLATYAATKAYVLSLSEALAEELRPNGVSVTALCPGITETNMMRGAQEKNQQLQLPRFLVGEVEQVAREGYQACMAGEVIRVPGAVNLATTLLARATPKWLVRRVGGLLARQTI